MTAYLSKNFRLKFNRENYMETLNKMSFYIYCLFLIDCAITGGGRWLSAGGFSLRMLLGLLALLCALPALIKRFKILITNPMIISLFLFGIYLIISTFIGIKLGHNIDIILSDVKGFSWLFLVLIAFSVVNSKERLLVIIKCILIASVVHALLILGLNFVYFFYNDWESVFYEKIIELLIGSLSMITNTMARIFTKSGPYLAVGAVLAIYYQLQMEKYKVRYSIYTALFMNAILLSFTRSLYGAAFLAVFSAILLYIIYKPKSYKRILLHIAVSLIMALSLIMLQQAITGSKYLNFAYQRFFPTETRTTALEKENNTAVNREIKAQEEHYLNKTAFSDNVMRKVTKDELREMIKRNPVFGNGIGAAITYREDGLVEYFYYDIINKMGILGLLLYYFPVIYMIYIIIVKQRKYDKKMILLGITWLSGLIAFLVVTYFNPYMNASLGISCYSITIGCFSLITSNNSVSVSKNQSKKNYNK